MTITRPIFNYARITLIGVIAFVPLLTAPLLAPAARGGFIVPSITETPLRFEQTVDGTSGRAQFVVKTGGVRATIDAHGVRFIPRGSTKVVQMQLLGSNPSAVIVGEGNISKTNYLIGSSAEQWLRGVNTFSAVRSAGVYSGIDAVYHGAHDTALEYDFVVAPGANPGAIRLSFSGSDSLLVDAEGNLHADGFIQEAPRAYQDTPTGRVMVPVRFSASGNEYGFAVGDYTKTLPLTIDPIIRHATYVGGAGVEHALDATVDEEGSVYLTGYTESSDFVNADAITPADPGSQRLAYVTKFTRDGSPVFTTYFGGTEDKDEAPGSDTGTGVAVDEATGEVVVRGNTTSVDFPTTGGVVQTTCGCATTAYTDAFVVRLENDGSGLVYGTYYGGTGVENGRMVALDDDGNVYIAGGTGSSDLPTTSGVYLEGLAGPSGSGSAPLDAFVVKLNDDATALTYATYIGDEDYDYAVDGGIDANGNVYIAGIHSADAWVAKVNTDGTEVPYSNNLGAGITHAAVVDADGVVTVVGVTDDENMTGTEGTLQVDPAGGTDAFVIRVDDSGTVTWGTYMGGEEDDVAFGVTTDATGDVYIAGSTLSTDFPVKNETHLGIEHPASLTETDAFLVKLDVSGVFIEYGTFVGGEGIEEAQGVAVDISGNVTFVGGTGSADFPVTENAAHGTFFGPTNELDQLDDVFIARVSATSVARVADEDEDTVTMPPLFAGEAGITATVANNTAESDTVEIALESLGPIAPLTAIDIGGERVGITATDAASDDVVTATVYYADGINGYVEDYLSLLHFDGAAWVPVETTLGGAPTKSETDDQDSTSSGGTFEVVFDDTSTPAITDLAATVLIPTLTPEGAVNALQDMVANESQLSFLERIPLNLDLITAETSLGLNLPAAASTALTSFVTTLNGYVAGSGITEGAAAPMLNLANATITYLDNL